MPDGARGVTSPPLPWWAAPTAPTPVSGHVEVPTSKSVTNRAVLLAALADGPSIVRRPLRSRDTDLMAAGLRALGAEIVETPEGWAVTPRELRGPAEIDVGLAGTVMRFLPAVATLAHGAIRFDGDARARERPMAPLLASLRQLGADVEDEDRGALPFTIRGTGNLAGGVVEIDASASSQLVSALLLPAARWAAGVEVRHTGTRSVPNAPHLRMTAAMLRQRGVVVDDRAPARWRVAPGTITAVDEDVEPDLSSAAPFLAAAAMSGGVVTMRWPRASHQPGALLPDLLAQFGAKAQLVDDELTVSGTQVHGADLDLRDAGELTPVLAAVAAVASSASTFTGIGYLRGHETDRLAALARELNALGSVVEVTDDGLVIKPGRLVGGRFSTYDDHRLVMAAAVLGAVIPGIEVENPATVGKTFPDFVSVWTRFVAGGDG
jgi:3-phosphoshikimate 1-carboxyvinyltransferase